MITDMLRPRRLRQSEPIRSLVEETSLSVKDLVAPLFIHDNVEPLRIDALPGHARLDEISLLKKCEYLVSNGVQVIALFPVIDASKKSHNCEEAINHDNILCHLTRRVKKTFGSDIVVIGDVALDPYSSTGHDGLIDEHGTVLNDKTVELLSKMAVIQAQSGVDIVAPSDMMDGRIGAIRSELDDHNFSHTIILSYAAKYASHLYGPFRDAVSAIPVQTDKKTYQMNPANRLEAGIELDLDISEHADMVMVKPASWYLDVISDYRNSCSLPVAAYQVSGEYAMIKSAAAWLNTDAAFMEALTCIKRAGASFILSYATEELIQSDML